MNFYDDDDFNYTRKDKSRRRPNVLNSILSAIIGGFIVLLILPSLINAGLIEITVPNSAQQNNEQNQGTNIDENIQVESKQINVDVNSGIVEAVEKVKPAVVGVVNIQEQSNFLTRQTRDVEAGVGTGIVFDKKDGRAYIVTNNHVIEGAKNIEVSLADGERVPAELLGSDELTDLAVIAIDDKYIDAVAPLGESTNLKPGEPAIAIGNPLGLEFSQSVTLGVISSNNRTISRDINRDGTVDWETDVIQTDAAINPGNSGGPLVNINGEVIGINSSKITESGVEGLGFAIPISDAKPIIDQLIEYGKVKYPYMGIKPYDLQKVTLDDRRDILELPDTIKEGIVLLEVTEFSPADIANLEVYDVIVKLDDQQITNSADLRNYLYKYKKVGDKMDVTYYREGKLEKTTLTLKELPND